MDPRSAALNRPVTRRNFIVWYLGGLLTATVVAMTLPLLVFLYPPAADAKKQDLKIKLDRPLPDLKEGQAVRFDAPKETGFRMVDGGGVNGAGKIAFAGYVVREAAAKLNVLAVTCSHLGCSVQFAEERTQFSCPCHGSVFSVQGRVLQGPALFPLSHLTWKQGEKPDEILIQGYTLKGIG